MNIPSDWHNKTGSRTYRYFMQVVICFWRKRQTNIYVILFFMYLNLNPAQLVLHAKPDKGLTKLFKLLNVIILSYLLYLLIINNKDSTTINRIVGSILMMDFCQLWSYIKLHLIVCAARRVWFWRREQFAFGIPLNWISSWLA